MRRRLAPFLVAVLAFGALAAATPGTALADNRTNEAVAVNLKDGSELFKFAFKVVKVNRDVVDQQNVAVSYASCEVCRTIAVAFQIVLVMSDPDLVTPENVAVALNENCTSCETLASAYQYVFSVPAGFRFSGKARAEIARIKKALREAIRSGEPIDVIQARIDALAAQLRALIKEEIAAFEEREKKKKDHGDDQTQDDSDVDEGEEPGETTTVPETTTAPTETEPPPTTTGGG
jgi:putative peptide zinc metalloprotease protein